ncbi:hypothetical protein HP567_012970 [Brevibacillus sp. M2.1A]|uniref:hypothetical protein n=1 Tax=Brevibacillus sp. M2.1A TaxID=2738980 RepID=UPI00156B831F|nr:hypothetical protein [Brevibacillus sp. M2.1A]MCC8435457.1 hypothetical protein [Brevibacillus sp. M2.1A]
MKREHYCPCCGLFFWHEQYQQNGERIEYVAASCPNPKCESQKQPADYMVFAVDTFGFAYFAEANKKEIDQNKWSSARYAPPGALEIYKRQGFRIVDDCSQVATPKPISEWIRQQTDLSSEERDELAEDLENYFVQRRKRIEQEKL